jgi:hypothetical protein
VLIVLGLGALLLKVACGMVSAPVPGLGRAMWIVFVAWLANVGASVVASLCMGVSANVQQADTTAKSVLLLVSVLVQAAVYSSMVPTSFGKGILIWLMQGVIALVVAVAAFVLIALALGSRLTAVLA